jgi:YesN/AraC family two-component response regulator
MCKVLIIEDNDNFRQCLKELLNPRYQNLIFEEARDGSEGIEKFSVFKPNIVFVDVRLPDRIGLDLINVMKGIDPKVRIIMMSNYDLPEYKEAAVQKGSDFFILKGSSTIDMILTAMQSILPTI